MTGWWDGIPLFDGPRVPLGEHDRPPFPVEVLPSPIRGYVSALACETQTPVDLAACLVLGAGAGALAHVVEVRVRDGWREPVNIYATVALRSGERKSAVYRRATAPIEAAERQLVERMAPQIQERLAEREVAELAAKRAAKLASEGEGSIEDAIKARQKAAAIEVPERPSLLADDVTPEAFPQLIADNGGRIMIASPEGGFFAGLSRYQRSGIPNLDSILKAHAGDGIRVNRVKPRDPVFVPTPAATLILAVQPEVIEQLGGHEGFRGRGLLARFLYALPHSLVGKRELEPASVSKAVEDAYTDRLRELLDMDRLANGGEPYTLTLVPEALAALNQFRAHLEPKLAEGGDLAHIADWANKSPGAAVRITASLHMFEHGEAGAGRPITGDTMEAALQLAAYFTSHARTAFGLMGQAPGEATARRLIGWSTRNNRTEFSERDAFQAVKGPGCPTMEGLRPALNVLADHRWIAGPIERPREPGKSGRTPSPVYVVNSLADDQPVGRDPGRPGCFEGSEDDTPAPRRSESLQITEDIRPPVTPQQHPGNHPESADGAPPAVEWPLDGAPPVAATRPEGATAPQNPQNPTEDDGACTGRHSPAASGATSPVRLVTPSSERHSG
jgi:replicative DNA helicase